jgi:hypothetical protein
MPVIREEAVVCYLHDLTLPVPLWFECYIAAELMHPAVMISPKVLM